MRQFLLFRCSKSDGGSTCSGIHTQQGDGSDLVVQGLKALGLAVLGGELQNVGHVGLLVSLHVAGDDDVLTVSQTVLTGQIVALLVAACIVQIQLGDGRTGGVLHCVLSGGGLSCFAGSSLRACSLGRSGSRRSHRRGSGGGGCRRTAGGHANSQCCSGSNDRKVLEFHVKYTPLKFLRIQINQQGVMDDEDDYTGISTKNQDAYVHFER